MRELSNNIIVSTILTKLKGKYIISYNELNDLLPKDLFEVEMIEKILDEIEKRGILFNEDIKKNIRVNKNYKHGDNIIDDPEKFYFYELYKSEKGIGQKENEYIEKLKYFNAEIKKIFFSYGFFIKLLLKDLKINRENINNIFFIDKSMTKKNIIINLNQYLKTKNNKNLAGINLKRSYVEKKIYMIKGYIKTKKQIQLELDRIQLKYNIDSDLFGKLIEDLEQGVDDLDSLSRLETELYPIIKQKMKLKNFTNAFESYEKINNLYKQYDIIKDKLITLLLPLVINIAKYYQGKGVAVNDLIQEGNMALIEGVERFISGDINKSFSQYITRWIRDEMSEVVARNKAVTSISKNLINDIKKFIKTAKELRGELLRNPTEMELAERLKWKPAKIRWIVEYLKNPIYIDSKLNESAKSTFKDLIPDSGYSKPEDIAEENIMKEKINKILDLLKPIEKEVIKLKFNLNDKISVNSYEEMAKHLSMSIKKIKDIENIALAKLKQLGDKFDLRDFL